MPLDLRRRLAAALIALSVGLAGALAALLWIGNDWIETSTLDRVLHRELQVYAGANVDPALLADAAGPLRYYRPKLATAPPADLGALHPGSYRDFAFEGRRYHVLVEDLAPGDRAWLLYDVDAFSERERWLRPALIFGVLGAALAAWLVSGWLARRALLPLDALVARIRAIDPSQRGQRLESWDEDGELDAIVTAMNEHMARLDALVSRERAFASAASHELRTPLAAIRGAGEVLSLMPGAPPEVLERIERSVAEAVADLDALLTLSQGRDLPAAQDLDLAEFLPRAAAPYLGQAEENNTRIVWNAATSTSQRAPSVTPMSQRTSSAPVHAPPALVGIIFTNLLRNAIRAAPDGEVRIEWDAHGFSVIDDGEGMTAEQLAHVFEPGAKGRAGGSGMGLYIARTLANRCGWTLALESESGRGTVARVTFGESAPHR